MRNRIKLNNLSKRQLTIILVILEVLLRRIKRCNDYSDPYTGICFLLSESCASFEKGYEYIITRLLHQNIPWYHRMFMKKTDCYWYHNHKRSLIEACNYVAITANIEERELIKMSNRILSSHDWYKPRIKLINKLERKVEKRLDILDNTY